ncbi:MAG TPA: SCO family protein, partial [Oxalobacteraceae bacterium]|nr:SCO family protein [Oxalobacteraceae bacterium]
RRLLADFQVVVVPDGRGDFEHNAAILVVDQHGRLVRIFDYGEQQLALDYARYLANGISR